MKVHYESVRKAIDRAINSAEEHNRRIEKIELTIWECNELISELKYFTTSPTGTGELAGYYRGVRIELTAKSV